MKIISNSQNLGKRHRRAEGEAPLDSANSSSLLRAQAKPELDSALPMIEPPPLPIPPVTRNRSEKGMTVIELILAVVVIAMMAISVMPKGEGLSPISLDAASRKVKADIRYAQNLSTSTGVSHGFRIINSTSYEIYNTSTGAVVNSPINTTPMQEDLSTDFDGVTFTTTGDVIEFDEWGRSTGGLVLSFIMTTGSISKQITVDNDTGTIVIATL